eukprot:Tamp_19977.p1 GENE.Tamp_19977~~Tamp_19977.p1  ORF type:complete len:302 (-),score=72.85 Tamp_19977:322-1197(-)
MLGSGSQSCPVMAKTDNAQSIINILTAIHLKRDIEAYCVIDKNGFRFTVQKSNCLQANVYLKKDLFTRFECEGNHQFGINLSLLIDCLSMLGTNSGNQIALQISYAGEGHPILLQMVDGDVICSGGIHPLEKEEPVDFCWDDGKAINRVIIKSGPIKDALQELDWWGNKLHLSMTPSRPRGQPLMRLNTKGTYGACEVEFTSSCDSISEFDCSEETTQEYRLTLLQPLMKALVLAEKVCLRLGQSGMLQTQLMIKDESRITTFVEFLICADAMLDEDDTQFGFTTEGDSRE